MTEGRDWEFKGVRENPAVCGVRGTLSDADAVKLQNLAFTLSLMSWDNQQLTCELPHGHEVGAHVQFLVTQELAEPVEWWASWYDLDGLRDQAAMFTGPICDEVLPHSGEAPGLEFSCLLLGGHTTPEDQRHIFK